MNSQETTGSNLTIVLESSTMNMYVTGVYQ